MNSARSFSAKATIPCPGCNLPIYYNSKDEKTGCCEICNKLHHLNCTEYYQQYKPSKDEDDSKDTIEEDLLLCKACAEAYAHKE